MGDVSFWYERQNRQQIVSQSVYYPDGVWRILSMYPYQWDWIMEAEEHGYPFLDVLNGAIRLAVKYPSSNGYNYDVLDSTRYMLQTIRGLIIEEDYPVSNSRWRIE